MALFLQEDVSKLLRNKFVIVLGDSNQRSVYKDLVNLVQQNSYTKASDLKAKGELSFMDDQLLHGGRKGKMMNGVNYREVRQYKTDYYLIRFYFVTRVHNDYVESIWEDLSGEPRPDVVIMNSCLWDVSRYGPTSMNKYKTNLEKTFRAATEALPPECLFIWNAALPVANKIRGGFLLPELDFLCSTLRLDVLEGNFYAKELASAYGLDVLDLHYFFRYQLHRRAPDGVHWTHQAHRRITNLILTHIASAWGLGPPRHVDELSRSLPSAEERQPARSPSPPNALGFIDFDKPLPGSASTKPKLRSKSTPAALGKMPEESETSSANSSSKNDDKSHIKNSEQSRPKSADGHQMFTGSHAKSDQKRPSSADGSLNLFETKPSSTQSRPNSADGRHMSTGSLPNPAESRPSRPSSAGNHSVAPPANQSGILVSQQDLLVPQPGQFVSPPKHNPISVVRQRQRTTRWAPYGNTGNNNNNPPPVYNGPVNNPPLQSMNFNNYNQVVNVNMPPPNPNFNMVIPGIPQMGYPQPQFQGQAQADMEWRREQRQNRVMHERGMELNYFGGFNW